ncbi:low-specificity L-threonine aldolase [Rossellomorea vietnamensis]|uniref:Low-specificity L-threonine aldolase n=1 Tax=Rossellomorea vietnamensis TaxID=218284 RepID=A0A5D4NXR4_9BACI|nr:low-specificity L-threonine aldolase [Rossellomorea vietnamensis]TYS18680.1 low-specificity L-threonine aldolase [Rossellomorea vietnamensis]
MIDLRSDTVTKPTKEMREAALNARVGDDVYGEDPAVNDLEQTAAKLLGKEAALFVTSGTQGNQIAVLTHCNPGNEVIMEAESHIFYYESGAISAFAGVQPRTLKGIRGAMDPLEVEGAIREDDQHFPETSLICIENTHNRTGGAIVPSSNMKEIYTIAQKNHIPVHVDGARLFNAASALGVPLTEFTQYCDTVQVCLSKGLGAPVGSIIAGSEAFIKKARKWRKRLGGGLRQAGIIAAPGLYALNHMRERLAEDHKNAVLLSEGLSSIPSLTIANNVDTNIVVAEVSALGMTSAEFTSLLKKEGILTVTFGPSLVRFTTHLDVSKDDIEKTIAVVRKLVES